MRRTIQTAAGIVVMSFFTRAFAADNHWMAGIDGNVRISQITIPGTHDSGARFEPVAGTARCQNATISEQLGLGVRFLDLRCRHIHDSFAIYHGVVDQKLAFRGALDQIIGFLAAHPSECVVVSIKEESAPEGATRSFEATFETYVAANPDKWWLGERVPALRDVRGKIVLLRRFGASAKHGIAATPWPDNTTFRAGQLCVQDEYRVGDNTTKWNHIRAALSYAVSDNNADILHLIFASGYQPGLYGIPDITAVSNHINPLLADFFGSAPHGHYGCVLMDFADAKCSERIYHTNFVIPERR